MKQLKLCSLNLQGGIERKFQFKDVTSSVDKFDIIFLQETWMVDSCHFNVRGYGMFRSDRGSHKKKSTGSGGVVTLYKLDLEKGVQKIPSRHKDFMWIRLDKNFFKLPSDMYFVNCYIPPEDSVVHRDMHYNVFEVLCEEITKFSKMGEVGIVGDLNARTGNIQEKLNDHPDDFHYNSEIQIDSKCQLGYDLRKRNNTDLTINNFGKKLIELVEAFSLIILNGRTLGDLKGEKTCYTSRGSSTVDYFIVSPIIHKSVKYMKVRPQTWYSDHSPVEMVLGTETCEQTKTETQCINRGSYIWNNEGTNQFKIYMNSPDTESYLMNLKNYSSTDKILDKIVHILKEAANCCLTYKVKTRNADHSKDCVFNNPEVRKAKGAFNRSWKLYRKDISNSNRYRDFIINRSRYKRLKYTYFRYNKEDKLMKLANIESTDPKLFWKTVRRFTASKKTTSNIKPDEWVKHFKDLLNITQPHNINKEYLDYIQTSLPVLEQNMLPGQLDYEITDKELEKAIKNLKNGKAMGPDEIPNEMIKSGGKCLNRALKLLFNCILKSASYPKLWRYSIITPIHKTSDPQDPSNYRGIAVADCMSKLFNSILNERIYEFFQTNGLWAPNQNGFMKKRRTEDNLFILHTLFQKYVKAKRQRLYMAFIDFRKYFDTINRDMLMYKLLKYGITGNVYKVLKSAYINSQYCVKTSQGNTPYFTSSNGVKQGCNLSPTLSNIYQNDLHDIFDNDCDPVNLDGFTFNSLSWADDLVLISKSMNGLQDSMNKLKKYCTTWGLTLNVEKTKFMIMNLGSMKYTKDLVYDGKHIEGVNSFRYLGLVLTSNGKFNSAIRDRCTSARKAYYQIRGVLSTTTNVSRRLAISIFDKQITPILSYGSSIWGQAVNFNTLKLKFDPQFVMSKPSIAEICRNIINREVLFDIVRYKRDSCEVVIRLQHYEDKLDLMRKQSRCKNVTIEYCLSDNIHECEKVHTSFCKYVLGMSKYSSNYAVLGELGRVPLTHKITLSHVNYWYALQEAPLNLLLRNAYKECQTANHEFIESIRYILSINGMGNFINGNMKLTKVGLKNLLGQRLKDQYLQDYESKLRSSFKVLKLCKLGREYTNSQYLDRVKNLDIRNIFTRLRINQTQLKGHLRNQNDKNCVLCGNIEDARHLLFECKEETLTLIRQKFITNIGAFIKNFSYLCVDDQITQVLNLEFTCPSSLYGQVENVTCNFVRDMYKSRFNKCVL